MTVTISISDEVVELPDDHSSARLNQTRPDLAICFAIAATCRSFFSSPLKHSARACLRVKIAQIPRLYLSFAIHPSTLFTSYHGLHHPVGHTSYRFVRLAQLAACLACSRESGGSYGATTVLASVNIHTHSGCEVHRVSRCECVQLCALSKNCHQRFLDRGSRRTTK